MPTQTTGSSWYWLSGVDVQASRGDFSIVLFGDSITDGMGSTVDANRRWPDYLSQRLNGIHGSREGHVGILNQGISGDRVNYDIVGPNARSRFDRDVLEQPGVRYVVSLIGTNELKRQAVNAWIRTSSGFDAILDFDQVLRNPSKPTQMLAAYDSGDHLHPNDAGYQAMANAVDLRLFRH